MSAVVSRTTPEFFTAQYEVAKQTGMKEGTWRQPEWRIWEKHPITPEILQYAFEQGREVVQRIFGDLGTLRAAPKDWNRVVTKIEKGPSDFRVLCDWQGVLVACRVEEIAGKIEEIRERVLANGGIFSMRDGPGRVHKDANGVYQDVMQFAYAAFPTTSIIEFQVGHPCALYTFKTDSEARNNPTANIVTLWDPSNLYPEMKQYLLDQANGKAPQHPQKYFVEKANALHGGKAPEALLAAIEAM